MSDNQIILYHGSKEIIEFPEIRIINALSTLKFKKGYEINE